MYPMSCFTSLRLVFCIALCKDVGDFCILCLLKLCPRSVPNKKIHRQRDLEFDGEIATFGFLPQ